MEPDRIESEGRLPEGVGSKQWASKLRKKARDLVRQVDLGNIELAEVLYLVWDTPVDGDKAKSVPLYTQWGHKTFSDYAESELGLKRRKAEYLRNIGCKLNQDLVGLDKDLKEKLMALGWTKVRILTSVLTLRNCADWIAMAEKLSYPELDEAARKFKAKKAEAREKREQAKANGTLETDSEEDEDEEDDDDPLPETDDVKWEHFMLYKAQHETVAAALARAKELSNSEKKGHNLEMICTDFLATNDFLKGNDPEMKKRYLAKVEQMIGYKLVAIDPESGDVQYGLQSLAKYAKQLSDEEESK